MSRMDDILTAIANRYADPTVKFECGKLKLNEHQQQRVVILVRQEGLLTFSDAPNRARYGTPVSSVGAYTVQRFDREELIEATLRAQDESALDDMFDRFVNAVFEQFGPNAFEDVNKYGWFADDSKNSGQYGGSRNPAIKLYFRVRLNSRSQPGTYAVIGTADADAILLDPEGATGATGEFVTIITT